MQEPFVSPDPPIPGPLVVGVDASRWDVYGHGIFDGCDRDATINHAVVLVGRCAKLMFVEGWFFVP